MFKASRYETPGEVAMRLSSTLIMYNGQPAFVMQTDGFDLALKMLMTQNIVNVRANDPLIDLNPPRLGYANLGGRSSKFVYRSPVTRYKQGADRMNTRCRHGRIESEEFQSKAFGEMILGIYPTFEEVLNGGIKNPFKEVTAFSRAFAFHRGGKLLHKDRVVGAFDGNSFELRPKFIYLEESLAEALKC